MSEDELIEKLAAESSPEGVKACLKEAGFTLKSSGGESDDEPKDDDSFPDFQKKTVKKHMKAFGADKEEESPF